MPARPPPLDETLKILGELGLTSAEINAGGFVPAPHLPIDDILASPGAREEYLGRFTQAGITLTGLNVNGNPLNPDPRVGPKHAADLHRAIDVAAALGVKRIVAMSGLPAAHPGSPVANWIVNPWDSQYLDILDYQWQKIAVPFWKDINTRAAAADVKKSASRCTLRTSSSTRPPCNASSSRQTPPTSAPNWTPATSSGRAWTRSPA
nr:hypothetical protein GCM10020092_048820 [Actinoplanes digitatis]